MQLTGRTQTFECCKVHTCSLCLDLAGDVYLKQLKCYLLVHTGGTGGIGRGAGAGARTGTAGKAGAGAGANMLPKADPGRTSALPDASLDGPGAGAAIAAACKQIPAAAMLASMEASTRGHVSNQLQDCMADIVLKCTATQAKITQVLMLERQDRRRQ